MKTAWTDKIHKGHHAYLISSTRESAFPILVDFLEKEWKISKEGNPDFSDFDFSTLHIDDCKNLLEKALIKPVKNDVKIFIVSFGFITREAANSLLKLFEDALPSNIFFAITPNPERLPATLRSRFIEIKAEHKTEETIKKEAEKFLNFNLGEKFEYSKKLASDISDSKFGRDRALLIMDALEEILQKKYPMDKKTAPVFKNLEKNRSYLKDQSSSVKLLFDSIAMTTAELNNKIAK